MLVSIHIMDASRKVSVVIVFTLMQMLLTHVPQGRPLPK